LGNDQIKNEKRTIGRTLTATTKTNNMKRLITICAICFVFINETQSQGCVAVRSTGAVCTRQDAKADSGSWQITAAYRYFRSFRHYSGKEENKRRLKQNTEVINWQHSLDLSLVRHFNSRWSFAINLPILSNARSSLYEHGGNPPGQPEDKPVDQKGRHRTNSFGIGDLRLTAYRWLLNPNKSPKINIQVGLGIKLATGDYKYQDYFQKNDTTKVLGPVDQSIQLGDGGTGFTTEINAYYNFNRVIGVYGNFYYLFNPREQNAVSTARGGTTAASNIANGSDVMSVPDQYMARTGINVAFFKQFSLSAGARMECVPVRDLIGGSNGFRRPGYIISAEPGLTWQSKKTTIYLAVPIAIERNRTQSVPDKIRTKLTGVKAHGDAAFADYLINIGCSFRL
jgi:hypothetical protein